MKASVLLIFLCLALTAYQYTENGRLKQLLFAQMVATSEAKSVLPAPTEPALEVPSADYEAQIPELRAEVVATAPSNVSEDQPNPFQERTNPANTRRGNPWGGLQPTPSQER